MAKTFTMNKTVRHNGKLYPKGAVIAEGGAGSLEAETFKTLSKAGHVATFDPEAGPKIEGKPEAKAK
jgi:hypothetical protein